MQKALALFSICLLLSCGNTPSDTLIVKGNIKGLKKGTVYLNKVKDTTVIILDSVTVNGNSNFTLQSTIDSPEIFYLDLNKNDNKLHRILFFGDKGITTINTSVQRFAYDAKIVGSKQQKILEEYINMSSKFNNKNLDLIKENFEAIKEKDTALVSTTKKTQQSLIKRRYLYTANFAINNRDSEVAPYLVLTELYNANLTLLELVNDTLTSTIKDSNYGKELQSFIDKIKKENQLLTTASKK